MCDRHVPPINLAGWSTAFDVPSARSKDKLFWMKRYPPSLTLTETGATFAEMLEALCAMATDAETLLRRFASLAFHNARLDISAEMLVLNRAYPEASVALKSYSLAREALFRGLHETGFGACRSMVPANGGFVRLSDDIVPAAKHHTGREAGRNGGLDRAARAVKRARAS